MILRKPYAFFIKVFKPLHIIMSVLVMYLTYKTNYMLSFLNNYMYSQESVVGEAIKQKFVSNMLFVVPIILIIFSIIFLGVMFKKKKPTLFYVGAIFAFLVIIIINIYSSNFFVSMEKVIVSIKMVKLHHDLIVINMIIEVVIFVLLVIRGLGINFRKFNFDSDLTKLNISSADQEEFELSINFNIDEVRRTRKKRLRYFRYIYKENKLIINISILIAVLVGGVVIACVFLIKPPAYQEGVIYSAGKFNIIVNKTMIVKENYDGELLTENNLIVVDVSLNSNFTSVSLFLKDFSLEIGEAAFSAQSKYANELSDIGKIYKNNILTSNFENYLLIFEIPDKYLNSEMFLNFNDAGIKTGIKLDPQKFIGTNTSEEKKVGEKLSFDKTLGNINFVISDYEIKEKFLIKYNYCIDKECVVSKEYIEPTINQNFDKVVLRLNVDFENSSKLALSSFYEFFNRFGAIHYKKGDKWYLQRNNFEQLKSKRVNDKNNVYIGINSEIYDSEAISLVFNIRNSRYEYVLK